MLALAPWAATLRALLVGTVAGRVRSQLATPWPVLVVAGGAGAMLRAAAPLLVAAAVPVLLRLGRWAELVGLRYIVAERGPVEAGLMLETPTPLAELAEQPRAQRMGVAARLEPLGVATAPQVRPPASFAGQAEGAVAATPAPPVVLAVLAGRLGAEGAVEGVELPAAQAELAGGAK